MIMMITFIEAFKKELEDEAVQTKRMLAIVPGDKMDWRPHPKSMTIRTLATHIADLPQMISKGLLEDKWDFAIQEAPSPELNNAEELLARYSESLASARMALDESTDDILQEPWVMCSGEEVWLTLEKWETFRHCMGQNAHHRAQLQVCLRLLDIPVPGPYGPSADEMS